MAELNLVPQYIKQKKEQNLKNRQFIALGIIAFCVLFILLYLPYVNYSKLKRQEISLKNQLNTSSGTDIDKELKEIAEETMGYNSYIEKVKGLSENKVFVNERILELEAFVPVSIVFDSLAYNGKNIIINGTSEDLQSISDFAARLQMSKIYSDVRIENILSDASVNETPVKSEKTYKFIINVAY